MPEMGSGCYYVLDHDGIMEGCKMKAEIIECALVCAWLLWPLALEVWDLWRGSREWRKLDREADEGRAE